MVHTLPDDSSVTNVCRKTRLGNIPKLTQHYRAPDFGKGRESLGETFVNIYLEL